MDSIPDDLPPPRIIQMSGDGAINVAGNVSDSTFHTTVIQSKDPPWYQQPPFPPELHNEIAAFQKLSAAEAAQRLFAVIPAAPPNPSAHRAPTSHLPYRRVPTFVGRQTELQQIAHQFTQTRAATLMPAIANGMMGIGKTSLALEFAYRYGRYFAGGVFWIDSANADLVPPQIAQIGITMGLYPEITDLNASVWRVQAAWQDALPRLLIFDNCDDPSILTTYAPTSGGSRILVTSRSTDWAIDAMIRVGLLPRAESITLLRRLAPRLTESEATAVAAFIDDLPLALHLAGTYLNTYSIAVDAYLAKLAETHIDHTSFAGRGVKTPTLSMPARTEISLLRLITVAVEQIAGDDPLHILARETLAILCCLAPGEPVLHMRLTLCLPETTNPDDATDARQYLIALGILEAHDAETVVLHRLLHAHLTPTYATDEYQRLVERLVGMLLFLILTTDCPFADAWLEPHAVWVVACTASRADTQAATLDDNLGGLYQRQGRYAEAKPLFERSLAVREAVLGGEHPDTATSLHNLANWYEEQGWYADAEQLYKRSLDVTTAVLGSVHLNTAGTLNNLAMLYEAQGRYVEAESLLRDALVIRETLLGREHPDTVRCLSNLATLYHAQARYTEAEPLLQEALAVFKSVYGEDHLSTATIMNNLAELYGKRGLYAKAEPLLEQVLVISAALLGMNHPDTARALHNLALLYQAQEEYGKAEAFLQEALAIYETVRGVEHPETAMCLNNLAALYYVQGWYREAEPLFERALAIDEQMLDRDHPSLALSLHNLAFLYDSQEQYTVAEPLYARAIGIFRAKLGKYHPYTQSAIRHWHACRKALGKNRSNKRQKH